MGSLTRPFVAQWVRLTIRVPRRVARRRRANAPFSKFISSFVLSANHFFYFFFISSYLSFLPLPHNFGRGKNKKEKRKKKNDTNDHKHANHCNNRLQTF